MVGVAERHLDHRQALEEMRGEDLVRDAHAAMDLHRLLADVAGGLPDADLGRGCDPPTFGRVVGRRAHRGEVRHRARLLEVHEHLDHPMLQHLEARDRLAELLAGLGIVERRGAECFHHPTASAHSSAMP